MAAEMFRVYQHDDILTQTVKTDAEGRRNLNSLPSVKALPRRLGVVRSGRRRHARIVFCRRSS